MEEENVLFVDEDTVCDDEAAKVVFDDDDDVDKASDDAFIDITVECWLELAPSDAVDCCAADWDDDDDDSLLIISSKKFILNWV